MNDLSYLLLMFLAGAILAGVYLAGLWLSVKYLQTRKHPALWFVMSLMLRLGFVALALSAARDTSPPMSNSCPSICRNSADSRKNDGLRAAFQPIPWTERHFSVAC